MLTAWPLSGQAFGRNDVQRLATCATGSVEAVARREHVRTQIESIAVRRNVDG
jgi:hypothetical protein